jgi:[ribosomal protein S5]-alanine N-acetyltransferase
MNITTERLNLRPFKIDDAPVLAALAGDPRVARMLVDIELPFNEAAARRWLRHSWGELRLGVERNGTLIGGVCYICYPGGASGLGYWLGAAHWGHGYALEAAAALLHHGFAVERMQLFRSAHFVDNLASGRVLQRLGFRRAGGSGAWCPARNSMVESANYALTRETAGYPPARATVAGWLGFRPLSGRMGSSPASALSGSHRLSGSER